MNSLKMGIYKTQEYSPKLRIINPMKKIIAPAPLRGGG